MERISTIQTASVITQPTEAVERPLTLIEKLEQKESEVSQMILADDAPFPYHYTAGKLNAFREIVNIVKQHSDWVSFEAELPKNLQRILVCFKEKGIISGTWFADSKNPNDGFFCSDNGLSDFYRLSDNTMDLWQPIQPPSEVQDD